MICVTHDWLASIVNRARGLAGEAETASDGELLTRFRSKRDEAAFDLLIARHAGMVWSVCRSLLPDDADAEDAFQATFVALVKNGPSIRSTATLGGWLHGTACKIAKKAKRTFARRTTRERKVGKRESTNGAVVESQWDEWQAIVHDEIAKLPLPSRDAFVACVLEGQRHQDAAEKQKVAVGTIAARVSRARQTILDRLTARGLAPAVAIASATMTGSTTTATVPSIVIDTLRQGLLAGSLSSSIHSLASLATEGATMKVKLLAATVLIGSALALTGGGMVLGQGAPKATPAPKPTVVSDDLQVKGDFTDPSKAEVTEDFLMLLTPTVIDSSVNPSPAFQYRFEAKPATLMEFQALLKGMSISGWEHAGSERFQKQSDPRTNSTYDAGQDVIVFKRRSPVINPYIATDRIQPKPTMSNPPKTDPTITRPRPAVLPNPIPDSNAKPRPLAPPQMDIPMPSEDSVLPPRSSIPSARDRVLPNSNLIPATEVPMVAPDRAPQQKLGPNMVLPTNNTVPWSERDSTVFGTTPLPAPNLPTATPARKPGPQPTLMNYYKNKATVNLSIQIASQKSDPKQVVSAAKVFIEEMKLKIDVSYDVRSAAYSIVGPKQEAEQIRDMIFDLVNALEKESDAKPQPPIPVKP